MTVLEQLAAWVHAEISDAAFAEWLWPNYHRVEELLGEDLALEIASLDFSTIEGNTRGMRVRLTKQLSLRPSPVHCLCLAMGERAGCMEDSSVFDYRDAKLAELKSHYLGCGATFLFACRECAQRWCMFGDDEDWFFLRLTREEGTAILEGGDWPEIFLGWLKQNHELWLKQKQHLGAVPLAHPGAETFRGIHLSLDLIQTKQGETP